MTPAVLKPGGRLIIADFKPKKERQGRGCAVSCRGE